MKINNIPYRIIGIFIILFCPLMAMGGEAPLSGDTLTCLDCHATIHPGIVEEWRKSRHARTTPLEGLKKEAPARRLSAKEIPDELSGYAVGCAECHLLNPDEHKDSFEHAGYTVHPVVTPKDCSTCHAVEANQYEKNMMSHAYGNLVKNPVYMSLADAINGTQSFKDGATTIIPPNIKTNEDSCFSCHGTKIEVKGERTVENDFFGEMTFLQLEGWPNQGVGRINPDGSMGTCAACHSRHQFSIKMARKPDTCSQCHKGPDVPAYKVYEVSKHGNIYASNGAEWNFESVPWTLGRDFTAPTCVACHVSLLVNTDRDVISKRTHQMNDRIYTRIFGLIYAHPHPESPDTSIIKNSAGLPLPTELTGEPVNRFLINKAEQNNRKQRMQNICMACHTKGWIDGHFDKFENTVRTTNRMTLTATQALMSAWEVGAAKGLDKKDSIFNEGIEKRWTEQWLFYSNSVRFASAMGGTDYGVFANGRYFLSRNIQDMIDWLKIHTENEQ